MNKAFILVFTLSLIVAFSLTPTATLATDSPSYIDLTGENLMATVSVPSANLRSGPGTGHGVVDGAVAGLRLPIIGIAGQGDDSWFLVEQPTSDRVWVSSSVVQVAIAPTAADITPPLSTMYISLDTSPGFFDRMDETLAIYNRGLGGLGTRGDIDDLLATLFLNAGVTADDVRPWLGNEVAIANLQCLSTTMSDFLMTDSLQETPRPSVVIIAQTVDTTLARQFINRVIDGLGDHVPHEQIPYGGYTYELFNDSSMPDYDPEAQPVAMGMVGDFAVFTQGRASYQAVIDAANGDSLSENSKFRDVYYQLSGEPFVKVYVSPGLFCPIHEPILYNALLSDAYRTGNIGLPNIERDAAQTDPAALQEDLVALLDNAFKGYAVSFAGSGDQLSISVASGIDIDAVVEITGMTPEEVEQRVGATGLELFGFLQPDAMRGLTFGRMTEEHDELRAMASSAPEVVFESQTGLSRDLLDWFEGTITMGFIDYPVFAGGGVPERPAYFLLILETQSDQLAQVAMQNFRAAALEQPGATDATEIVEGVEAWRVGNSEGDTVQVAALENFVMVVTGGNLDRVIRNGRRTETGRFFPDWQLLASLPTPEEIATSDDALPFVAFLEMGRMMTGATAFQPEAVITQYGKPGQAQVDTTDISTLIETAAIVTTPESLAALGIDLNNMSEDEIATLITIICRICNSTNC